MYTKERNPQMAIPPQKQGKRAADTFVKHPGEDDKFEGADNEVHVRSDARHLQRMGDEDPAWGAVHSMHDPVPSNQFKKSLNAAWNRLTF